MTWGQVGGDAGGGARHQPRLHPGPRDGGLPPGAGHAGGPRRPLPPDTVFPALFSRSQHAAGFRTTSAAHLVQNLHARHEVQTQIDPHAPRSVYNSLAYVLKENCACRWWRTRTTCRATGGGVRTRGRCREPSSSCFSSRRACWRRRCCPSWLRPSSCSSPCPAAPVRPAVFLPISFSKDAVHLRHAPRPVLLPAPLRRCALLFSSRCPSRRMLSILATPSVLYLSLHRCARKEWRSLRQGFEKKKQSS